MRCIKNWRKFDFYWNNNFDVMIYILLVLFSCIFSSNYDLILKMISIDSLFLAIHFFKTFVNHNLTESQIVSKSNMLYEGSLLDRYILYITKYITYKGLCYFFWVKEIYIMYFGIHILIIPPILNKILTSNWFKRIREKKEKFVKIFISKQCAEVIKFFSKIYLNKNIEIKYKEIIPLLNNYQESLNYIFDGLKNLLVILLLEYIKKCSPNFYYRVTKYIYNYKTGETLASFNAESAKKTLNDIIDKKRWEELLKPNSYRAIIYLYQENEERVDIFKKFINEFNYLLVQMFAIWTCCTYTGTGIVAPIISILLIIWRGSNRDGITYFYEMETIKRFISIIVGSTIGIITSSFFLTSLLCQFGYGLMYNKLTISLINFIVKKSKKQFIEINNQNSLYVLPLITSMINILIFSWIMDLNTIILIASQLIFIILTNYDVKNSIIFGTLLVTGYWSNYNILHLIINSLLIYFGLVFIKLDELEEILWRNIDYSYEEFYKDYEIYKRLILDKIYKNKNLLHIYFLKNYDSTKNYIKLKIKNGSDDDSKTKSDQSIDLLDTDKYPSYSKEEKRKIKNKKDLDKYPINDQKILIDVEESINNDLISSMGIDSYIFNLDDKKFIKAISVEKNKQKNSRLNLEDKKEKDLKSSSSIKIIDNYY